MFRFLFLISAIALATATVFVSSDATATATATAAGSAFPRPLVTAVRAELAAGGVRSRRHGDASPRLRYLVERLVRHRFAPAGAAVVRTALCVVRGESGFNPGAVSGTGDYGVFQINWATWRGTYAWGRILDPVYNVDVGWAMSKHGTHWWPWVVWKNHCRYRMSEDTVTLPTPLRLIADAPPIKVALKEWTLKPSVTATHAGAVTFIVRNAGGIPHEFVVVKSMQHHHALPMEGSQALETGDVGEIEEIKPGQIKRITIKLRPGKYILLCNLPGHYKAGQYAAFTVR